MTKEKITIRKDHFDYLVDTIQSLSNFVFRVEQDAICAILNAKFRRKQIIKAHKLLEKYRASDE